MNITNFSTKKILNVSTALLLALSTLLPALLIKTNVEAAQITARKVDMSSSLISATGVTYTVSFSPATTHTVQGIVVDFCTSALVATTCTAPTGLALTAVTPQTIDGQSFTMAVSGTEATLTNATGSSATSADTYSFTITATNPSTVGTFYARIVTYTTTEAATSHTAASPGAYTDNGGVAMTTTNDLTVTGTVTETLTFCVGATDSDPAAADTGIQTCGASGFTSAATVGLGVIDSTAVTTPRATADGGTNTNGAFLIKTNAVNGATVGYRANLNTSSGNLKVAGATCSGTSTTDACINSAGTTATTITGELFGMAISEMIYPSSKTGAGTTGLVRDTEYDFTSSNTYAWDGTGTFDQIASSTGSTPKVLDWELGVLKFSAVSAPTTPSGSYTVSANFVATGTF